MGIIFKLGNLYPKSCIYFSRHPDNNYFSQYLIGRRTAIPSQNYYQSSSTNMILHESQLHLQSYRLIVLLLISAKVLMSNYVAQSTNCTSFQPHRPILNCVQNNNICSWTIRLVSTRPTVTHAVFILVFGTTLDRLLQNSYCHFAYYVGLWTI